MTQPNPDAPGQVLDEIVFDIEVRFCWVDEDGARMSPIHKDIGKALNFVIQWPERYARVEADAIKAVQEFREAEAHNIAVAKNQGHEKRIQEWEIEKLQHRVEALHRAKEKLTRTGKPPVRLLRLVTRTLVEPASDDELAMAGTMFKANGLDLSKLMENAKEKA